MSGLDHIRVTEEQEENSKPFGQLANRETCLLLRRPMQQIKFQELSNLPTYTAPGVLVWVTSETGRLLKKQPVASTGGITQSHDVWPVADPKQLFPLT